MPTPKPTTAACTPDRCAHGNFCCPNGCKDTLELDEPSAAANRRFRKKPVVIEAVQWDGVDCGPLIDFVPDGILTRLRPTNDIADGYAVIATLEGEMYASPGDWIIKGVQGEFYPCKPDIFEQTYEEVESDAGA